MLANYGYTDASGSYYITIDTDRCNACGECLRTCPAQLLEVVEDDYGASKAQVKESSRRNLKYLCAACKPASGWKSLPCLDGCKPGAIRHGW